jgi:hypothetical protein
MQISRFVCRLVTGQVRAVQWPDEVTFDIIGEGARLSGAHLCGPLAVRDAGLRGAAVHMKDNKWMEVLCAGSDACCPVEGSEGGKWSRVDAALYVTSTLQPAMNLRWRWRRGGGSTDIALLFL